MSPQDKVTTERHSRTLRELVKRPENRVCADCKHNGMSMSLFFYRSACTSAPLDPRWASWNMCVFPWPFLSALHVCISGVFLCIRCSGIHRGMGTHISKVKSIDLDAWTPEQMDVCRSPRLPLSSPVTMQSMQSRTYRSGAIALLIYTGKHTSNLDTSHRTSECIFWILPCFAI
jgi:hypothetical protein